MYGYIEKNTKDQESGKQKDKEKRGVTQYEQVSDWMVL